MEAPGSPAGGGTSISDVIAGALPGILKRGKVIVSPYPFGLSDDDNLRVTAVNSVAGVTVNIHTRRVLRDQSVTTDTPSFTPPATRVATSIDVPLAGGYTTNLSVFASGALPLKGQCFVIVQMIRGLGVSATVIGTLLAGTITQTQAIGWPGSPIESSTDGEPVVRTIIGTAPGGGADIVETVPFGARWELLSIRGVLTLGGGAAATTGFFTLDDGANIYAQVRTGNSGGPTTVNPFVWSQEMQPMNANISGGVFNLMGLTPNRMLAGHRITLANDNAAGQKTWAAPVYNVREWQEAP